MNGLFSVQGRIEYFSRDLHAADCLYHHSCDVHFRTLRSIPIQHRTNLYSDNKRKKVGRPMDTDQEYAFLKTCSYFENNDEEQFTVSFLANKMKEYLQDSDSVAYGNQYLKSKLVKHYGEAIFVADGDGLHDIVTFWEKTSRILRNYFNMPKGDGEEAQKRAIIETAAKLIKSDIKTLIPHTKDEYPNATELELDSALTFVSPILRLMLQHLLVGNNTSRKEASIGQAIVLAARPRAVIAPLQLGLGVQMHHHLRSRFEENAASSVAPDVLGEDKDMHDMMLLFAADNVDHNIVTLDGKGTFHGMGMVAAITPGTRTSHTIPRRKMSDLNIVDQTKIEIKDYGFAKNTLRSIKFTSLPLLNVVDHNIDVLWEMFFRFKQTLPNWQGVMHLLHKDCLHPGQSSVLFLPMIDMNPGDKTVSSLHSTIYVLLIPSTVSHQL